MKKSKFLLLGSVASLASIPFVAAKCGENKEEEKKPEVDKKPGEGKEPGQNTDQGKNPETDTTPAKSTKIDLNKLEKNIQNELEKLAKNDVSPESVLDILKKVRGLEKLTLGDFSTVEFKDEKLTVKAHKDSKLITGEYEFKVQSIPNKDPLLMHKNKIKEFVFKNLKELNVENTSLVTDFEGMFKDLDIDNAKTKDDFARIKDDLKYLFAQWYSSFEESPFGFDYSESEYKKDDKNNSESNGGNPYVHVARELITEVEKEINKNKDNEYEIFATLNYDVQLAKEAIEKQVQEQNQEIEKLFRPILNSFK
ncbi:variable surface lipoprotein [Mycoplasmopsis agalactiae]|nr:variable surface lipoprotein [Mycoplasmopsis agalactiae]MCE6056743.1 variable surface lipoprotein [Mycoplasmopsis agalactiae]